MRRGQLLFELLLLGLAAHGLGAEGLDPWRGWVVFKEFARAAAETPDTGVSVQVTADLEEHTASMVFVRQVVAVTPGWLEPAGGVVCEFTFGLGPRKVRDWEAWSFDTGSFERFVDLVEESAAFQDLAVQPPIQSAVYWLEA